MSKKVIKAAGGISKGIAPTYYDGYENVGDISTLVEVVPGSTFDPKTSTRFPKSKTTIVSRDLVDPDNSQNTMRVTRGYRDDYDNAGNVTGTKYWATEKGRNSNGMGVYIRHELDEEGNVLKSDTSYTAMPEIISHVDFYDSRKSVGDAHFEQLKTAYESKDPITPRARTFLQQVGQRIKRGVIARDDSSTSLDRLWSFNRKYGGIINYLNMFNENN